MAKAQLPVTAACICGKIELCADEQPLIVYLCHCIRCQTTSGTDYQHNARFEPGQVCGFQRVRCKGFAFRPYALLMCSQQNLPPRSIHGIRSLHPSRAQLSVTKGKDDIVSVRIPGAPVKRHYCGNCHVRVFHERLDTSDNIEKQVENSFWERQQHKHGVHSVYTVNAMTGSTNDARRHTEWAAVILKNSTPISCTGSARRHRDQRRRCSGPSLAAGGARLVRQSGARHLGRHPQMVSPAERICGFQCCC